MRQLKVRPAVGVFCVCMASFMWALAGYMLKYNPAAPSVVACIRSMGGSSFLIIAWLVQCLAGRSNPQRLGLVNVARLSVLLVMVQVCTVVSHKFSDLSSVVLIYGCLPLIVMAIERAKSRWQWSLTDLVSVVIMSIAFATSPHSGEGLAGFFCAVLMTVAMAGVIVLAGESRPEFDASLFVSAVIVLIGSYLITNTSAWIGLVWSDKASIFFAGVISFGLAMQLLLAGAFLLRPTTTAMLANLEILFMFLILRTVGTSVPWLDVAAAIVLFSLPIVQAIHQRATLTFQINATDAGKVSRQ